MHYLSIHSLFYGSPAWLICVVVASLMFLTYWVGFRVSHKRTKKEGEGLGPIEGSMLGLLALILAFTFGMAGSKYDSRRAVLVQEANKIGTAILRADLYPDSIRDAFRKEFRLYLESRITYYEKARTQRELDSVLKVSEYHSKRIWNMATNQMSVNPNAARVVQMIPALNEMIDVVSARDALTNSTIPESIWFLLFLLTLSASFISGYGSKSTAIEWPMVAGFVCMTSITIFIILDLDRPRRGTITLDKTHEKMVALRSMFTEND